MDIDPGNQKTLHGFSDGNESSSGLIKVEGYIVDVPSSKGIHENHDALFCVDFCNFFEASGSTPREHQFMVANPE